MCGCALIQFGAPCVGDAERTGDGLLVDDRLELRDLAGCFAHLETFGGDQRDAGGVVAAVL
jgi:hypothetical protein